MADDERHAHRTNLARAAARLSAAEEELVDAQQDAKETVARARAAKFTWADIEAATGLPDRKLRWLSEREQPYVAEAKERLKELRAQTQKPRLQTRPGRGPGIGVTEATRRLGVSRTTIYKWIEAGRLRATENDAGVTRILGGEGLGDLGSED